MTGASPLALLMRMIAAFMLATIGVHAAAPASQPLERSHGSAFSAATYNVSLKNDGKSAAIERLATEPFDGGVPIATPISISTVETGPTLRAIRPRAPPLAQRHKRPAPTGPPIIRA